jgi:hypothetical protein
VEGAAGTYFLFADFFFVAFALALGDFAAGRGFLRKMAE